MRVSAVLFLLLFETFSQLANGVEPLGAFSPEERAAIDRRVLDGQDVRTEKPKKEFYGTLAGWGIARVPLSPQEELTLAEAEHRRIVDTEKTFDAPKLAKHVLKKLAAHLPGVEPPDFAYSLTIVEIPEIRSWTVGGGFLYLSRPMYEALTNRPDHAENRLAFVLAHEMGHIVYQHCRVGHQLLKLEDLAKREPLDEEELSKLRKALNRAVEFTGNKLRFLYEPHQEYEADLFAAHLCRNAGFDVVASWDVLRQGVITEEQAGDLGQDPASALISSAGTEQDRSRAAPSGRLRQLVWDRDGIVRGDQYGLWEFDRKAEQWIKPQSLRITTTDRVVLFVHGMDSTLTSCHLDCARKLIEDSDFDSYRILGFQYPGDASLAQVGEFLAGEISRAFDAGVQPDLVGHSAGGLVVRYYLEVKRGPFRRFIMQGTPNHGSDWVRLRPVVEMKQFFKDLRSGYSQAVENVILDGQGQIAHDLQPGSLFLNYLNGQQADRSRYAILRGRRFGRTRMLLLGQTLSVAKSVLQRKIEGSKAPQILRDRALQSLEKFELPDEVRNGDLIVSAKSAELPGVSEVQTFKLHHGDLSRDPEAIEATIKLLKTD